MTRPAIESARIYVADGEPANLVQLGRILAAAGFGDIGTFADGETLLAASAERPPDLVLLDLHLPRHDGYVFLTGLRARSDEADFLPIVFLTAEADRAARSQALAAGVQDFLIKPFDSDEVILRIRNLLATRFLELALRDQNRELEVRVADRTRELRESLDQLRVAMEGREALLARLVNAQEEERRRIAGDIHDGTIQTMVAVGMRIELLSRTLHDSPVAGDVAKLRGTVRDAIHGLRNLLFELHPAALDREGLGAALRAYLERLHGDGGPAFSLHVDLPDEPPAEIRMTLYRIALEALVNARKHAEATRLEVSLESTHGGYLARVADDGRGFDRLLLAERAPGHLGIPAMVERAEVAGGWCRVTSAPGGGTTVETWLPAAPRSADLEPDADAEEPARPARSA